MGGWAAATTLIGDKRAEAQRAQAGQNAFNAMQGIQNVKAPSISKMRIQLQNLVQQGILSPEMAETFLQESSAYDQMDPQTRDAQLEALASLQGVVSDEGLDPQSIANLEQAKGITQAEERGQREAILQNAAARGIAGSGIELASKMGAEQGAATRLANQGFQAAADANQRKLAAIQGVGQLGGQVRAQDAEKAAAQNAINQFNAANRQAVEGMNVGARNQAQQQNLAEKQRIADTNIGLANQQEAYNKSLYQQDFANRLGKAQAYANTAMGAGQQNLQVADAKNRALEQASAGQNAKWSDENLKTGVKAIDPEKFLDELTGYKYKYKSPEFGKGEHVGVMAQDVEKVAPEAVAEMPEGKAIDFSKMGGPILAALASMNTRIKELEGGDAIG